jgi:hypothetical protein
MPLESSIQAAIGKRLKAMGAWYQKNAPGPWGYTKGRLDFTIIYKGRGIALEVKRPGQKPTPTQLIEIERVRAAGGIAEVVHSADEASIVLQTAARTPSSID